MSEVTPMFPDFPTKRYSVIYADPPWTYRDKANAGERGAGYKYSTLTVPQLCALPVPFIAADDCLLAMWHVPPMPEEALQVVKAWGFTFKTMKGFTWHKLTVNGKSAFGMGNWTRANAEDCLFATRGRPKRVSAGVRSFIEAKIREHSRKPDEARDRLVELMGDVPRIELFARQHVAGWDVWGLEAPTEEPNFHSDESRGESVVDLAKRQGEGRPERISKNP